MDEKTPEVVDTSEVFCFGLEDAALGRFWISVGVSMEVEGLEREIDRRVYALYGLTEEEIKIVEG